MKVKINIDEKIDEIFIEIYTLSKEDENLRFILENLKMKKSVLNAYSKEKIYLLNINDIYSIYAENKKVYARTKDKKYIVNHRLYELEEILDGNKFVRISNSAIINIYKIENLEASINGMITINFKNGEKEYISRRYLKKVKKILDIWGDLDDKRDIKKGNSRSNNKFSCYYYMLLGVLVVTGTSQITIQISEIIKYIFIIMVAGFIISSSTIIFSIKNMSLVIKGFIHLIITLLILKGSFMYLGILNEDYLIQAIFISLYIIVAAICLITIISENKTDVKMINERLKIIQKIKD